MNFWEDAKSTKVTWRRDDPRLYALAAELDGVHGVYALVSGKRMLRVGSTPRSKNGALKQRLLHHLIDGLKPVGSSAHRGFPAHWEFHRTLIDQELTILTLACPMEQCLALERAAKAKVPGGELWEEMRFGERAEVRDAMRARLAASLPAIHHGAVTKRVRAELMNQQ